MCSAKYHLHFIASRSLSWILNLPSSEPKFITLSKFINSRSQAQQLPTHSHNFDVLPLLVISQTRVLLPKFRIVDLVMALIQLKSVRKLFHCDVRSRLHLWGVVLARTLSLYFFFQGCFIYRVFLKLLWLLSIINLVIKGLDFCDFIECYGD
jgi:hypothetical protein